MSEFGNNISEDSIVSEKFSDENVIGEGASCIVYRMRIGGLLVAVKRLRPEFRFFSKYLASYRKEFMIGQQLKHDALPVYRELKTESKDVYIIMDYVDGASLEDFIKTGEGQRYFSPEENTRRFFIQLLNVVGYLNRSGVIHCDLKPSNIMRNSDRAVMLLDLDKAYCDMLDNTHGGTRGSSAPLLAGEKPSVAKDFTAIGCIFNKLADTIPGFKASKFRKFRDECDNPEAAADTLLKTLQPKSHSNAWIIPGAVALIAVFAIIIVLTNRESRDTTNHVPATDTIVNIINVPAKPDEQSARKPELSNSESIEANSIRVNFETGMSDFISYAQTEQRRLTSESKTDREISAMSMSLSERYISIYSEIVRAAKENNPNIPGSDVELAVATASERSKALALLKELTQASLDTLKRRNPDFYAD